MNRQPKIRLSRLRDIGWRFWDPIGLAGAEGAWEDSAAADEYDGYLLTVAAMIKRGESNDSAVKHLIWAESEHMGLGLRIDTQARADATIAAIHADDQLWNEG
ncbi:hypothetical protein [Aquidulcibacter sp.]|uniref:hypothetical protein n=1 Tax=Aquidulcibacter sp. TaxID=2052990 RepID=UPI0025C04277|nr:hypothetical protein [Aquidulcibacter sp.]MCA3692553.1 hypothetical protein [Aquidulcibacter sp.]